MKRIALALFFYSEPIDIMHLDSGHVVGILMVTLLTLASFDLWRQYSYTHLSHIFSDYREGVLSTNDYWTMGFRVENLELKLDSSKGRLQDLYHALEMLLPKMRLDKSLLRNNMHDFGHTRASRIAMHELLMNDSSIYQIECDRSGHFLRVGLNDFRTDRRDSCQIFAETFDEQEDASMKGTSPHSYFEKVDLDEGAFALRPMGNHHLFVQSVPPPMEQSALPWKLVVGSPVNGILERFRIDNDSYLFSATMGGYFRCGAGQMVKGFSGASTYSANKFMLKKVSSEDVYRAQEMISLSDQIVDIQKKEMNSHETSLQARKSAVQSVIGSANQTPVRICVGVPMTSKSTRMKTVKDSPFWSNLFDSFMKSIDWRSNRYIFRFYLGFDKADELYDTGDAWSEIREEFKERATFRLKEQHLEIADITKILDKQLTLKLMHFDHLEGAPTQIVSQLMLTGYVDSFDYFYQVNDDTLIETPNWPPKLIEALAANPKIPNFGVTGPLDTNNDKIFTHSFVHRTHIEVFGHMFPTSFKNWWSDDWISTVYGSEHTFHLSDVTIKHNVEAQKENGYTRYEVDQGAQLRLNAELRKGYTQIDDWLKKNEHPRLPLPVICGYIPLVRFLYEDLKKAAAAK